jgi:hypothetical protein
MKMSTNGTLPGGGGARGEDQSTGNDCTLRGGSNAHGEDLAVADPCDGVGYRYRTRRPRFAETCAWPSRRLRDDEVFHRGAKRRARGKRNSFVLFK